MARLTISEKREKAVQQLAERKAATPTINDLQEARKAMNSLYRFCGFKERLLYLQNEEKTCNTRYTKEQEEKAFKWFDRLNTYLKPFDACIVYFGCLPTICKFGTKQELYLMYLY